MRRCRAAWRCCSCSPSPSASTRRRRWCTSRFWWRWRGRSSATLAAADSRWRARARRCWSSPARWCGIDGTSAYNDVAVAAIAFTLFHLLQIWDEERTPRLLAAIGLAAGFAFAAKYTAWPAVAYAVGFVLVKNRKAVLPVAACAAVMIAPWLLKNWIYLQNPVAPFFNRQFPNPYVMVAFEDSYRHHDGDVPPEIALGDPDGGDDLRVAFGIAGAGVPAGAAGAAGAAPARGPATVAGGAGFRRELLQQHRDAVSDSAAALRGAGDDAGVERHVPQLAVAVAVLSACSPGRRWFRAMPTATPGGC